MSAEIIVSMIIVLLYCFSSICFGSFLLRMLAPQRFDAINENTFVIFCTAFLLGQGLLAGIWQLLALFGLFSPQVIIGVMVLSILSGVRFVIPIIGGIARRLMGMLTDLWRDSPVWRAVAILITLLILMTGISTINPPQPRGDSIAFYMALAKVVAASHHLVPLPGYETFTQIGLQGELHFAALMSLSGGIAAKMFMWPTSLGAALMLLVIGGQVGLGQRGKLIALTALFTSTAFTSGIWNGKVDIFPVAMGLAAFYWAVEVKGDQDAEVIRLAGLFTGLAIIAKISYLIPLVPGILLLILWRYWASTVQDRFFSKPFLSKLLPVILWLLFWTAVPLLPHVIKNAMLFGQPLAPLISSTGESITMQSWFTPETTRKIILTYPFALVYGQFWGQGGHFSPLLLAFTPLVVLLPRSKSFIKSKFAPITLAGMVGILSWLIYNPSAFAPRYIMASLLVLLLLGSHAAEFVIKNRNQRSYFLEVSIISSVLVALIGGMYSLRGVTKSGLLIATENLSICDTEQTQSDASCRIASIINAEATPEERVFLAAYYRYWLRPNIIQCLNVAYESRDLTNINSMSARWSYVFERGFRYLIVDKLTHSSFLDDLDIKQAPKFLEVVPLFEDSSFVAYRLDSVDPNRQPLVKCGQINPPAWEVVSVTGH